jgi:hypothetical protein
LSLLENPADGMQAFAFEPALADALRLTVTGYGDEPEIAEIEVLGR